MGRWAFLSSQPGAFLIHPPRVLPQAKQETLRLLRDSPPASALYVHDRVSGWARGWSNHPGLEICCGCIPPSDNVAMDHTSPLPNPGPARSDREPEGTHHAGKMNTCAKPFSLSKLSKFPQNKKVGFPPEKSSEKPSPGAACGERPNVRSGKR